MNNTNLHELAAKAKDYLKFETEEVITWCGGCGNYSIQNALKRALTLEGFDRKDVLFCFDVGCNGNGADKIEGYTIHGLHGRVISLAAGAVIANPKMKVIAAAGDGATFSEGVNHLVHAVRNDYPMLFIFHNNENYGLTTGQASAMSRKGWKMNGTPDGVVVESINAMDFVLTLKPSFVARTYSGDPDQMTEVMQAALKHKGFAFVEVLQACPTYNKATPDHWYGERVKKIEELAGYDKHDIWQARKIVQDMDKEIYVGVIYEDPNKQNFMEMQKSREGISTTLIEEVKHYDISECC